MKEWEDYPPPVRDPATGCLRWQGPHHTHGYGKIGARRYAHRIAWERVNGPIPAGQTIDHVHARGCRHRDCVEVAHMELVTQSINAQRSLRAAEQRSRTTCPHGHSLADAIVNQGPNGRLKRHCRTCHNERCKERKRALRSA